MTYAYAGGTAPDASADYPNLPAPPTGPPTGPPAATTWTDRPWADPQRRGW